MCLQDVITAVMALSHFFCHENIQLIKFPVINIAGHKFIYFHCLYTEHSKFSIM